ncbi:MAG TPA: hypothetical protein PLK12_03545 [Prolixibacteraceae bacterium]|nr:hypothetical protein [Prolixibacteraceae bacterium]
MDQKDHQEKKKQLLQKIGKYSTAAGAVLLTGNLANAIVYPTQTTIDLTSGPGGAPRYYPIDFDHDGLGEVSIGVLTSYWTYTNSSITYSAPRATVWLTYGYDTGVSTYEHIENHNYWSAADPAPLELNKVIGPTLESGSFWNGESSDTIVSSRYSSIWDGNFGYYPNETRYLGVRFTGDGGTNWYYGWVGIQIFDTPLADAPYNGSTVGRIIDYAYETDTNTEILAGSSTPVPVLPIASALGLGLVGLFAFLRNRRKKNHE